MNLPDDRIDQALQVLAAVRALPMDDPRRQRVQRAVDGLVKDGQRQRRAERRRHTAAADRAVLADAVTAAPNRPDGVPATPATYPAPAPQPGTTRRDRHCYVCRTPYRTVDAFYHALCPDCADLHRQHRRARTDLTGRHAVVTGGRVKIGFQVALKLLRDGAHAVVVTRFPADAARRFTSEPDADAWSGRLSVIGADLRDPRQVLDLAGRLSARLPRLDVLINNAAQTVRRSERAYQPLRAAEALATRGLPESGGIMVETVDDYRPALTSLPESSASPAALMLSTDATGALLEPGWANSWTARLGQVDPVEVLEVQLVNVVAPFLLVDRLRPLLARPAPHPRYVVNVTGREGWFTGGGSRGTHPHTAVSKAALNMLTRAGAEDLAREGIHLCSVDTGWVTDESPGPLRQRRAATGWRPPLDVVDAAARIYQPLILGEAGTPVHGILLKDYRPVPW